MIQVTYDPKEGNLCRDGQVEDVVNELIKQNIEMLESQTKFHPDSKIHPHAKFKVPRLKYSTSNYNVVVLFTLKYLTGEIAHDDIEFWYEDSNYPIDDYGFYIGGDVPSVVSSLVKQIQERRQQMIGEDQWQRN